MQLQVNAADKVPLLKFMFKRCRRLLQMWRDLAKSSGWGVELQLSSDFTMDYAPLQNEALICWYRKIIYWNFLPEPGPSKCPWAWALVAVKIISILYHVFVLNIKIHLLEMYVSFLQTDGSWLTLDSLLNINYAKNIDSGSHETPKQETSSGFANIAQPPHVPGLPVHVLGSHKMRGTFALQNAWRVGATWNTEMLRSISSFWTNTWPTLWWSIPICDMPHPLGHV